MAYTDFDVLKFALASYNEANKNTSRRWSIAAAISIAIISTTFVEGDVALVGNPVEKSHFLIVSIIVLAMANFAYCVSHAVAYRMASIYQSIVSEKFPKGVKLTEEFSWFDLAQRVPSASITRIYPLLKPIEKIFGKRAYDIAKLIYDIMFCGFPVFSMFWGVREIEIENMLYYLALLSSLISSLFTLLLVGRMVSWPGWITSQMANRISKFYNLIQNNRRP